MKFKNFLPVVRLSLLASLCFFMTGCGPSLGLVRNNFYDYDGVSSELARLHARFSGVVTVQRLGTTYEGRSLFAVKVTGTMPAPGSKPALLAIFTEHGDEHDTTDLAVGIIRFFAENYGKDERITGILNQKELWIVPLMNPDGAAYDLSGSVRPFSWRKNRRPTGENTYGVDLNRNWGRTGSAQVPEDAARELRDKASPVYAGERPFSENETQAVTNFLLDHPNIMMFVDYHSGNAGFLQGGIGFPIPPSGSDDLPQEHRRRYEQIAEQFAKEVSNPDDKRPAFIVNKERDIAKTVKKYAPWYLNFFIPDSIPLAPGTSGEWVYGELGIMAFGVEIFRDGDFFKRLPASKEKLIENQIRGAVFLLDALSEKPFP